MHRRQFLASTAFVAAAGGLPSRVLAQAPGDAALNSRFDAIFAGAVARSPEQATSLGLDKGALAASKGKLSPRTAEYRAMVVAATRADIAGLESVSDAGLSPAARLNRDVVLYSLRERVAATTRFGMDSAVRPYRIFQQGGAYFSVPDFLNTAHTINTAADAEAYLSRLDAFATVLDQEAAMQADEAGRGLVAPAWSLDLTLGQMRKLRAPAATASNMVESLVRRTAARGIDGEWQRRAAAIVADKVYPALDRQMALVGRLRPTSKAGDGIWRIPRGDEVYAMALAQETTTTMTPDEVHALGLAQVAEISGRLDDILKSQGFSGGTVGERLARLNKDPAQVYPDTAAGRAALIAGLNADVAAMAKRLPRAFNTLPTQPLEVRAVPVEIQDGASNGYYNRASLDGSRPAIYFVNLKDVGDWPKYTLPALTYHEGVPGHHLQISLAQQSADIPTLRKIVGFPAYSEGWALYAEQLAEELGAYGTPLERAGYLQSFLFRATRLVVDTGIHAKRWSREKAIDYMAATTGFARPRTQREVERYCTQAGQACSYKVGHAAWTRARARVQQAMGDSFDLKAFHDILQEGAMPLSMLERRIDERLAAMQRKV